MATSISPGHVKLAALMDPDSYKGVLQEYTEEDRERELQRYSTFPLYPTGTPFSPWITSLLFDVLILLNSISGGL